ncbi:MAG: YtxH domain-containing protein [Solibacillus sp.]
MTNKDAFEQVNDAIYGEDTMDVKDFVIGALIGGIVGAAAALLLAPKSGSELRGDVAIQAVSLKDKSVELSHVAKDKTAQLSSQIKEQSTHLVDKVMTKSPKVPTDDGTVSLEGEEPLAEVIGDAVDDVVVNVTEGIEKVAEEAQDALLVDTDLPKEKSV